MTSAETTFTQVADGSDIFDGFDAELTPLKEAIQQSYKACGWMEDEVPHLCHGHDMCWCAVPVCTGVCRQPGGTLG